MASSSPIRTVHVVRLGTAAAPLDHYLRGHEDAVSWTSDVRAAIPFLTADAAARYAKRRLSGTWHVAEVDRSGFRCILLDEEVDAYPERDAGVDDALMRLAPESVLVARAEGERMAAHRRAIRIRASSSRV